MDNTPVENIEVDAMEAAVVAQLVNNGIPYKDALAQVKGGQSAAPQQEPVVEDIEPAVVPQKSNDFSDDQVALFELLENIEEQSEYELNITIPAYLMDWLIRKTLQEAYIRNNDKFLLQEFMVLMLKEQRAIDPTKGGKVKSVSSGPKDNYNPATGNWS